MKPTKEQALKALADKACGIHFAWEETEGVLTYDPSTLAQALYLRVKNSEGTTIFGAHFSINDLGRVDG